MLPNWQETKQGYTCADTRETLFAVAAQMICGFDVPRFDIWLDGMDDCGIKQELIERRQAAMTALLSGDNATGFRHLEWCHLRRQQDTREQHLLPLARREEQTQKRRSNAGKKTAKVRQDAAKALRKRIVDLWNASTLPERNRAAAIAKRLGKNPSTVRDHLKKAGIR